jgi:hypothetical protein
MASRPTPSGARSGHTATMLGDETVLVAGRREWNNPSERRNFLIRW